MGFKRKKSSTRSVKFTSNYELNAYSTQYLWDERGRRKGKEEKTCKHNDVAPVGLGSEPQELRAIEKDHNENLYGEKHAIQQCPGHPANPQVVP
jgi:hypothetical protein